MDNTTAIIFSISFIFLMTCLGASIVFLIKKNLDSKYNIFFTSFAGGIMLASCIWSLLIPALNSSQNYGDLAFLPTFVGFLLGCLFMFFLDWFLEKKKQKVENDFQFSKNKRMLFVICLHNVPEGLSVGVALGCAMLTGGAISILTAISLAVGIGIQNIPEGLAVSLPMFNETSSKPKAFGYGVLSGIFEPISAIIGLFLSSFFDFLLPWLLAFAGGTMIYTIVNELLPETQNTNLKTKGTWGFIFGFLLMMTLDVIFA